MARVKRSPSSPPPPLAAHRPSLSSRSSDDPIATLSSSKSPRQRRRTAVHPHDDQQDELDCLPAVIETSSSPARPLKVPNKLHTPSASPHSRPAIQPTATSRRNNDLLHVPERTRTREGRTSPVRDRYERGGNAGSAARRNSDRYSYAETRESAVTDRRTPAKRSRPGEQYPAPSASSSRSPSPSALSPERSAAAGEGCNPTSSARKRSQRASSGLTFKPPAPSALTEDRDFRAAQRARLQEQRMRALAKRRRVERVDEDEEDGGTDSDATSVDEEEGRQPQNDRTRAADRRTQAAAAERSPRSGHARAQTRQASKPSPRPPKAPTRIKPDPDETTEPIAGLSSHPPEAPAPSLAQPAAPPPPPPSATKTAAPPPILRRYPTPPTASAFLTTLPLPSLARLAPHFHAMGCTSPGELLVLCDPAQRPLRDEFLKEVADKAGGVSALERMMLHREMDCGWRKWTGASASGGEDGAGAVVGALASAGTVA